MRAGVAGWGLFAAWAVPDTEEVPTASWWSRHTLPRLRAQGWPGWLLDSLTSSTAEFAVAVVFVGAAVLLVSWRGVRTGGRSAVQATVLVFGWHGLLHIGQAVLFRGYVPGLVVGAARPPVRIVVAVALAAIAVALAGQIAGRLSTG
jgi:uncharacterized protein with HXXEE motif